jgi:hypothetical protein
MTVNSTGQPRGIIFGHGLKKPSVAEDKKAVRESGYITGNGRTQMTKNTNSPIAVQRPTEHRTT